MAILNGVDPEKLKSFIDRIDNLTADLESEKGSYMSRCKVIREDIKVVKQEASDAGIPKRQLNTILKRITLHSKFEAARDDMDGDDVDLLDQMEHGLGLFEDTPLGSTAESDTKPKAPDAAGIKEHLDQEAVH